MVLGKVVWGGDEIFLATESGTKRAPAAVVNEYGDAERPVFFAGVPKAHDLHIVHLAGRARHLSGIGVTFKFAEFFIA